MYLHILVCSSYSLFYFHETLEYVMKRIGSMILEEGGEDLTNERCVEALKEKKEPNGNKGTRSTQANSQWVHISVG